MRRQWQQFLTKVAVIAFLAGAGLTGSPHVQAALWARPSPQLAAKRPASTRPNNTGPNNTGPNNTGPNNSIGKKALADGSVTSTRRSTSCSRSGPWRIMPLGDSLTLGSMDQRGYSDSYRKALWQFLQKRNFRHIDFVGNREDDDGTFDGNHSGWGGFKSQSDTPVPSGTDPGTLYAYIEKYIPQPFTLNDGTGMDWVTFANPDIVLLNIGTNDGDSDSDVISHRLRLLVDVILAKAPTARVILSSLPPSGGNIAITPLVGVEARKLALASGGRIFYADIRTRMLRGNASLGAAPFAQSDWREDLTHLSQSGGPKFAAAWLPTVEAALKAPRCA